MFSFMAFKALHRYSKNNEDISLKSPVRPSFWEPVDIPSLGKTHYLRAGNDEVQRGYGVFAGMYDDAIKYGKDVYLVAPDPVFQMVEGNAGWRAGAAFVVDGPFSKDNLRQAAEIITAAFYAGYPQIKDILMWAASICKDGRIIAEIADESDIEFLYRIGREPIDENLKPIIVEKFIRYGKARHFLNAGIYWPDCNWDCEIAKALINTGDALCLYDAGLDWPKSRWTPDIALALIETDNGDMFVAAGKNWPDERWHPDIALALVSTGDAVQIAQAGYDWPDRRWTPNFAERLLKKRDPYALVEAGASWPDKRWTPAIADTLIDIGNAESLYGAATNWSDSRYDRRITEALINTGDPKHLYLAGIYFQDSRYTPEIARALIDTGDAKFLAYAGLDWPDKRWIPDITEALIASGSPEWLYFAHIGWSDKRWSPAITKGLIAADKSSLWIGEAYEKCPERRKVLLDILVTEESERIYEIYMRLPPGKIDNVMRERMVNVLIEKVNTERLLNAAITLPDEKYDPAIVAAIEKHLDEAGLLWLIENIQDSRYDRQLIVSFCDRASPYWLAVALIRLSLKRYDKVVADKFFEKADPYLVFETIRTIGGRHFRERILKSLIQEKNFPILEHLITILKDRSIDIEIADALINLYISKKT